MRLHVCKPDKSDVLHILGQQPAADYIYMYPPRQVYRPFGHRNIHDEIVRSLNHSNVVNLYFHFPFCRQICAFCNLFVIALQGDETIASYMQALEREVEYYAPFLRGKTIDTVYLGGGTPSLLSPLIFEHFFAFLEDTLDCNLKTVPEIALEAAPDTVEPKKFRAFRELGINRVNLGVQSTSNVELRVIGRRYRNNIPLDALDTLQDIGFQNVCVDLIYGLQSQTLATWRASVMAVAARQPETVCAYPLTLRPRTGFASRGYTELSGPAQYEKHDAAREILLANGYSAETHIRYIRNAHGGYRQKANHWMLKNIIGFGAGARSYLWYCDYRNGYSCRHRVAAFRAYLERVAKHGHGRIDGYLMDDDERRRKALVLGLLHLDRPWFARLFGKDPFGFFPGEIQLLIELGMLHEDPSCLAFTPPGRRFRDILVQLFFSKRVQSLIKEFDYDE